MQVLKDASDIQQYCEDWLHQYRGEGSIVLRPKTVEECSAILKYCNDRKLAVNLQGGNTGLVGGSVPVFDEIVVSTSLMNSIIKYVECILMYNTIVVCTAGSTHKFSAYIVIQRIAARRMTGTTGVMSFA